MKKLVLFYPDGHEAHREAGHPERPERVEAIRDALDRTGWWQPFPRLAPIEIPEPVLTSVHSTTYLSTLKHLCQRGDHFDMDTYTTPATWDLANRAAGGACAVAAEVWSNSAETGFALTRPPGHHARGSSAMGFCVLNNIAIAAEYLIQEAGAERLAIVDLDLHHGNGTQDIFYKRGDVFYLSTHQSPLYPGTGWLEETGDGPGEGTTANIPLPPYSGDMAFKAITDKLILPLLDRFEPEMILVSYGFDTHWSDPLGSLLLSAEAYGGVIQKLVEWSESHCQSRIALFLEGGYNLDAARSCSLAVVAALLGETIPSKTGNAWGPAPEEEATTWASVVERATHLWKL